MDDQLLKQFYDQEHMRVEVYKFFKQTLDEIGLERMYKGEETNGMKLAKEVLIKAEDKLKNKFTIRTASKDPRRAE